MKQDAAVLQNKSDDARTHLHTQLHAKHKATLCEMDPYLCGSHKVEGNLVETCLGGLLLEWAQPA